MSKPHDGLPPPVASTDAHNRPCYDTELLAALVRLAGNHEQTLRLVDSLLSAAGTSTQITAEQVTSARSMLSAHAADLTAVRVQIATLLDQP